MNPFDIFCKPTALILFDMDGVLVLSEPLQYKSWFVLAEEFGFSLDGFMSFEESVGISDTIVSKQIAEERQLLFPPDMILRRKREIFIELVEENGIDTPPGLYEFIDYCRSKFRIGLVSSSSRYSVDCVLKAIGLENCFEFCVTGDDVSAPKPAPEPYLLALEKSGVKASAAIAIEDSENGIMSAKSAEICVLPFKTDFYTLAANTLVGAKNNS